MSTALRGPGGHRQACSGSLVRDEALRMSTQSRGHATRKPGTAGRFVVPAWLVQRRPFLDADGTADRLVAQPGVPGPVVGDVDAFRLSLSLQVPLQVVE